MITLFKGIQERNYLVSYNFNFHSDIKDFLYYADSPLKNYEYFDVGKAFGIQVLSGNASSGINIYSDEEPSALYTTFRVIKPHLWTRIGKLPHYPRYRALNPYQRYEYLTFLCNPYEKSDLCYVYLLFYALERRLSEGQEEVIPIMHKLADAHGSKFKQSVDRTIRRYNLWKSGNIYPTNTRVFYNYTLHFGCNNNLR